MFKIEDHRTVYVDMDGTIADTYSVEGWEDMIKEHDETLFLKAEPANKVEVLDLLDRLGSKAVALTMLPESSICHEKDKQDYYLKVKNAKTTWLKEHFPMIEEIKFVGYGESKSSYCQSKWDVLIDDSTSQLSEWGGIAIKTNWALSLEDYFKEELDKLVDPTLMHTFLDDLYSLNRRDFKEDDYSFDYGRGVLTEDQFHRARVLTLKLG